MKWITMARLLCVFATLHCMGRAAFAANPIDPTEETFIRPAIKCETRGRKPCTEAEVKALNDSRRSYSGKRKQAVEHIRSVTILDRREGILKCERLDGNPCNEAQRVALVEIGRNSSVVITIQGADITMTDSWHAQQ